MYLFLRYYFRYKNTKKLRLEQKTRLKVFPFRTILLISQLLFGIFTMTVAAEGADGALRIFYADNTIETKE